MDRFVSTVSRIEQAAIGAAKVWRFSAGLVQLLFMLVCAAIAAYAPIAGKYIGRYLGRLIRYCRDRWPSFKSTLVSYLPTIKTVLIAVADHTVKTAATIAAIAAVITIAGIQWLKTFVLAQLGDGIIWQS